MAQDAPKLLPNFLYVSTEDMTKAWEKANPIFY